MRVRKKNIFLTKEGAATTADLSQQELHEEVVIFRLWLPGSLAGYGRERRLAVKVGTSKAG
jgi:hypothetical protein